MHHLKSGTMKKLLLLLIPVVIISCNQNKGSLQNEEKKDSIIPNQDKQETSKRKVGGTKTSNVQISFMDQNGNPAICKRLVISDGKTILEFNEVDIINEVVPSIASYRFVWSSGGFNTMEQIPLSLEEGKTYDFIFYCLDRNDVVQHKPYLLFEEKDAKAKITWEWNRETKELDVIVTGVANKIKEVVVWVDIRLSDRPNFALVSAKFPIPGPNSWSICIPANVNINFPLPFASEKSPGEISLRFTQVKDELEFVGIRKALYKDFIIDTFDLTSFKSILKDIKGRVLKPNYFWPQYGVIPGYYHLTPIELPREFIELSLPLKVESGKVSLYELYPPKSTELKPFIFNILAEYYHTRAKLSSLDHNAKKKTLTAFVKIEGDKKFSI